MTSAEDFERVSPDLPELTDAEAKRLYDEAKPVPFGATEVEQFVRRTVDPQSEILALQKQRNDVYEERDRLVAALSKCFPSWLARHPDSDTKWDGDWRWIVFVQLPTGQATWHIQDRELPWFDHLERHTSSESNEWDGHTTVEKYARLERLAPSPDLAAIVRETKRLVDALTANGEHEDLIEEERVESLPDEQHNEIVFALRSVRAALKGVERG